jgi:hypothetical protein
MAVRGGTPLDSISSHKFAYIIQDKDALLPKVLMLTPYLHERRVYLNKPKSSDLFYTSLETPMTALTAYNRRFGKAFGAGRRSMTSLLRQKGQLTDHELGPGFTSIICVDMDNFCYEVYQQNGLLINKVDFKDLVHQHGVPIQSSPSGLNFVFKKSVEQLEDLEEQGFSKEQLQKELMTFSIMQINIFGVKHIKEVYLLDRIDRHDFTISSGPNAKNRSEQHKWLIDAAFEELRDKISFEIELEDNLDVGLRLRNTEGETRSSLYFYESNKFGQNNQDEGHQRLYTVQSEPANVKFTLNEAYLFFYDDNEVKYFSLTQPFTPANLKTLRFNLDPQTSTQSIQKVRTLSSPSLIVLSVRNAHLELDHVIVMDVALDKELESYDIEEEYVVIQDGDGNPYIVTESKVYFINGNCVITAYNCKSALL